MHILFVLLCLLLSPGIAAADPQKSQLTAVRTFTAPGQLRLLLVLRPSETSPSLDVQTRASPALGAISARGIAFIGDLVLSPDLPTDIPIGTDGVKRVRVAPVGNGVQVTIELDQARPVRAERIDPLGIMVDLLDDPGPNTNTNTGTQTGDQLPTREQLVAVLHGVDLVRAAGSVRDRAPVVVLDAGHGGWDHGAVGPSGTREADIALQLVLRTSAELKARLGAQVILTRSGDEFVTLRGRAAIANQANADLFLSVHANAAPGPGAWGIETYSMDTASDAGAQRVAARENAIARREGLSSSEDLLAAELINRGTMRLSRELSAHIQRAVCQRLGLVYGADTVHDLGTKTALFTVLTRTRMPAVLFESSFVSNPVDERRLRAPFFQQSIASALVDAIGEWLQRQGQADLERR